MKIIASFVVIVCASAAWAQSTRPAPASPSASEVADQQFKTISAPRNPYLIAPEPYIVDDPNSIKPKKLEGEKLLPEDTRIFDRLGRLRQTADGKPEFLYESDGQTQVDAPMLILPNLKLAQMERAVQAATGIPKFIITGTVTEYGDRNYILIEKLVVSSGVPVKEMKKPSDQ